MLSGAGRAPAHGPSWSWYSFMRHCSCGRQRIQLVASFAFPPSGFTLQWWRRRCNSEGMWTSLANSVVVGLAPPRSRWCWAPWPPSPFSATILRPQHVSFLVVLPITLPGIVTGIALNATFTSALGITLGMATVIIGHATFCIVIVFNNTQARFDGSAPVSRTSQPTSAHRRGRPSAL